MKDWEALRWRRLDWALLPHTTRKGALSFLSLEDSMGLNHAMTNNEARPHLIKSYKDMRSPAFDQHVYTDKEDYRALRWVIKKGIDLQGFRLERAGEKRSGRILARLMGWDAGQEEERKLDIAKYYVTRGKMQDLDEAVDGGGATALYVASCRGHVDIVKGLMAAGANKDKAVNNDGTTPLFMAARMGHNG